MTYMEIFQHLKAVLHEINYSEINQIVVGGDVILGPMSRECLDALLKIHLPVFFIRGNCETSVLDHLENKLSGNLPENVLEDIGWKAGRLSYKHYELLSKWPQTINLSLCHGSVSSRH